MRYKLFGRSGLRVSEISLGTMNFGNSEWGIDAQKSRSILDAFAHRGGNFIDTAHVYAGGASERIVGDFIASDRDHFVVASKYTSSYGDDIMKSGNSRRFMMRAVEESLKRLRTDYIDLYYLHIWDFTTPIEEVMRGLEDLVRDGKILYAASSDMPAWEISRANMLADLRGWAPFIGIQVEYSLAQRTPERDLIPMASALDLGVVAWSPLAGGALAQRKGGPRDSMRGAMKNRTHEIADAVRTTAEEIGAPPAQVALAALRRIGGSEGVLPIIGASSVEQWQSNLGFLDLKLTDDQFARIDKASRIELGFPHDMLRAPSIRALVTGSHDQLLDNHRHILR